jgi:serine/threonine-protein kinase
MGAVYLARDLQLDRLVAIKELPDEFASDPTLRERFLREVRMAASFSHPNIVPVYAVEEEGQALAFVMGYVEGESLADRVRRAGPLSVREIVRLLLDVTYALAYAHGRGVVHRDIKPDNIMIERATGRALLMDFGVARSIAATPASAQGMTRVGEVVGTPEYMSPEQATGESVDGRSDLYSLGLVAYFAVTGAVAFGGDSAARILVRQLTEALPPIASVRSDLPAAVAAVVDRCVAKERDERYADAGAMIEALDAAQAVAPEIPLAIRLLANELNVLLLLMIFLWIFAATMASSLMRTKNNLTGLLPVFAIGAVFFGRVLQTRSEVRRIRADGFSDDDIRGGLLAVVGEREARRAQLRANPAVVEARKRTVRMAAFMLVLAVAMFVGGFQTRYVENGHDVTPPFGIGLILGSMVIFGLGLVLMLRNPLAQPADERFVRRVWLGPIGRFVLGVSSPAVGATSLRVATAPAAQSVAAVAAAPSPPTAPANVNARLDALEARVTKLEKR